MSTSEKETTLLDEAEENKNVFVVGYVKTTENVAFILVCEQENPGVL